MKLTRRTALVGMGSIAASAVMPPLGRAGTAPVRLTAGAGAVRLVSDMAVDTPVWCYDGQVPGPLIRTKQGQAVTVDVRNDLSEATTVHWHGLRGDNAMDGVPYLTQAPIAPGETFPYTVDVPDAGTFWYHPHLSGSQQIGRGLYGAVIVDGADPIAVDRDVLWVLDDWRLDEDATIHESFGNGHDGSHGGRLGNVATINGTPQEVFDVTPGERIRLRLLNTANARVFGLEFKGHDAWIVAMDGHPVSPTLLGDGRVTLGPGQRADLIIDMMADPATEHPIIDGHYARQTYQLAVFRYREGQTTRKHEPPRQEAANPVPEPDLANPLRFNLTFDGGAMRGFEQGILNGETLGFREIAQRGFFWTVNGVVRPPLGPNSPKMPLASVPVGRTAQVRITNNTAWEHPVHLHGFAFRVLAINGKPPAINARLDTILLGADDVADIAFVCDRLGDWAFHCHILEHQESGMMGFVRVG